jgi:DNA-binding XRE family transcriptional regulator
VISLALRSVPWLHQVNPRDRHPGRGVYRTSPLGARPLQDLRLQRGWSQGEVARRAGLCKLTVLRAERGQGSEASIAAVRAVLASGVDA